MITYIFLKDSTLWAFEGPEEPKYCADFGDIVLICGNTFCRCDRQLKGHIAAMSTARESALPLVDDEPLKGTGIEITREPVALPGWWLDRVEFCNHDCCQNDNQCVSCQKPFWKYRLKRSEPANAPDPTQTKENFHKTMKTLTFYSGKLWHSDKPFPTGFQLPSFNQHASLMKDWLSTAYEVVNPEVIPEIQIIWEGDRLLVDGDQITLPEGYGIKYTLSGRIEFKEVGHSEATTKAAIIITPEKPNNSPFDLLDEPENSAHGYTKLYEESGIITESQFIELNRVEPSESQEEIKQLREWNEAHKETNKRLHDLMVDAEKRGERKGWNEAIDKAIEIVNKEMEYSVDDLEYKVTERIIEELKRLKR